MHVIEKYTVIQDCVILITVEVPRKKTGFFVGSHFMNLVVDSIWILRCQPLDIIIWITLNVITLVYESYQLSTFPLCFYSKALSLWAYWKWCNKNKYDTFSKSVCLRRVRVRMFCLHYFSCLMQISDLLNKQTKNIKNPRVVAGLLQYISVGILLLMVMPWWSHCVYFLLHFISTQLWTVSSQLIPGYNNIDVWELGLMCENNWIKIRQKRLWLSQKVFYKKMKI